TGEQRGIVRIDVNRGDLRRRRSVGREIGEKRGDAMFRPFDVNLHTGVVVAHPADEIVGAREAIHERPEPDALHGPADSNRSNTRRMPPATELTADHGAAIAQVRLRQPTSLTQPPSTSTGTDAPPVSSTSRARAATSASTSYSMNGMRF